MCSGKTTLGRALGRALQVPFVDLDNYIEEQAGMTVSQIFATQGEAAFRQMETDALASLAQRDGCVVACGGGTPCFGRNMELMNSVGTTVFLQPIMSRLLPRLYHGKHKRPLIAALPDEEIPAFIEAQMAKRLPFYSQARHTFDSSWLEDDAQIAQSVENFKTLIGL